MRPILAAAVLCASLAWAGSALAGPVCAVADPTGTPLNVRSGPNGAVEGTLENGVPVEIIDRALDRRGRAWVLIRPPGATQVYGWVFATYLACD